MAGTKISELPVATTLTGAELVPVVQSGATKQTTLAQMPYVPDGTGAVTTTVQSKLRETVSVKDFGAVGDGVTDDTAAVQAALNTGAGTVVWPSETLLQTTATLDSNQIVNAKVKGDLSGGFLLTTGASEQTVVLSSVDGSVISGTGSQGVGHTGGNSLDTSIALSRIDADRFGILINYDSLPAGATPEGFLGIGNFVKSGFDGYELNGDLTNIKYNVISSNVINAGANQVSPTTAFGVGLSSTHYSAVVGNVIKASVSRALHIEDKQKGTVFAANSGLTSGDGVYVIQDPATDSECDGVIAVGNHLTHTAASATSAGISINTSTTRSPTRNVFVGNELVGFNFGASVGPMTGSNTAKVGQQIIDGNVFDGSAIAIRAFVLQQIHGDNIAVAPTTLFNLANRTSTGKMSATAAPTNIITRTDASFPGAYCRGFDFPVQFSHSGSGYQNLAMFPVGDRMSGKIVCRGDAGINGGWWCCADIVWDGSTLTTTNILRHLSGNAVINGTTPFVVSGGNLCAYVTYPTPYSSTMYVEFDGIYYKV